LALWYSAAALFFFLSNRKIVPGTTEVAAVEKSWYYGPVVDGEKADYRTCDKKQ
jgi:hypothetical protein